MPLSLLFPIPPSDIIFCLVIVRCPCLLSSGPEWERVLREPKPFLRLLALVDIFFNSPICVTSESPRIQWSSTRTFSFAISFLNPSPHGIPAWIWLPQDSSFMRDPLPFRSGGFLLKNFPPPPTVVVPPFLETSFFAFFRSLHFLSSVTSPLKFTSRRFGEIFFYLHEWSSLGISLDDFLAFAPPRPFFFAARSSVNVRDFPPSLFGSLFLVQYHPFLDPPLGMTQMSSI